MKRVTRWVAGIVLVGLVVGVMSCTLNILPPIGEMAMVTLEAQAIPISKTVAWDANAPADAVTNYVVRLDAAIVGSPVGTTQLVTFTSLGTHTITVVAQNLWGTSAPATLVVNVISPNTPANIRLQ